MRHPARKAFLVVALALAAASAHAQGAVPADNAGARGVVAAADFKLESYAGRVVMLDFWASWCKPCAASMPWLTAMQRMYGKKGLQVVAVCVDKDEKAMRSRLDLLDPNIVVVFDPKGKLAETYKLEGMPTTFLIGRDGKVAGSHIGFRDAETDAREAELAKMLEDKPTEGK